MRIYDLLGLGSLDCTVAIIKNAQSGKMGRKDIIKIDTVTDIDLDVLGYVDPGITVNVIRGGELVEKKNLTSPSGWKMCSGARTRAASPLWSRGSNRCSSLRPRAQDLPLPLLRGQGRALNGGILPNALPRRGTYSIIIVSESRGDCDGTYSQGL